MQASRLSRFAQLALLGTVISCQRALSLNERPLQGGTDAGGQGGATSATGGAGAGGAAGAHSGGTSTGGHATGGHATGGHANAGGAGGVTSSGGSIATGGNAGAAGAGGVPHIEAPLKLTRVDATQSGKLGKDISLHVLGSATTGSIASVEVTILDSSKRSVQAFDTNKDGKLDSATLGYVPTTAPKTADFDLPIQLLGAMVPNAASVRVVIKDKTGASTTSTTVWPITTQLIANDGDACDPAYLASRCADSLVCSGVPPTCSTGTAPTITRAVYTRNEFGPILGIEGLDPDNDVVSIHLEFLSDGGDPVQVPLNGDGSSPQGSFDLTSSILTLNGTFSLTNQSMVDFDLLVPQLALTPVDSRGKSGATQRVKIADPVMQATGKSCDLLGSQLCGTGLVCSVTPPALIGKCDALSTVQTAQCKAAQVLNADAVVTQITGTLDGVALWDVPSGCASPNASGNNRPDTVVVLKLTKPAPILKLSTAVAPTNSDTLLFVLPSCNSLSDASLVCGDDVVGERRAEVIMTNVAAGTYYIVVKSNASQGGPFGLKAERL